jgi:hypothetical protein
MESMDDQLMEVCRREFERQVAQAFEIARNQPIVSCEIPIIGSLRAYEYSPHAPWQQTYVLERFAVKALLAQKWFEDEAPKWAQPLPLTEEDCVALLQTRDRRPNLRGKYGQLLRELQWELTYVTLFEVFCAGVLGG